MVINVRSFSLLPKLLSSLSPLVLLRSDRVDLVLVVCSLGKLNELALGISGVVLPGPVDVVFRISQEFDPMSDPSCHSGNSE